MEHIEQLDCETEIVLEELLVLLGAWPKGRGTRAVGPSATPPNMEKKQLPTPKTVGKTAFLKRQITNYILHITNYEITKITNLTDPLPKNSGHYQQWFKSYSVL